MQTGLRRLHYFQQLASDLNFRQAAVKLGITQPALSRAINLLEDDVGTRLLERDNREVRLTLAGESFLRGCERVMSALDGAVSQACKVADGQAGQLTVGYTDTAISGLLPDFIRCLRIALPEVTLHLKQAYSQQQKEWLDDGKLDIAFMTGPSESDNHASLDFQHDRFIVILPVEHPAAKIRSLNLEHLAEYPFVMGDPIHWQVYNAHFLRLCQAVGFTPDIVQSAPDSRGIVGMVACGMGISVQTESLGKQGDPRITFRRLNGVTDRVVTQAVWNTRFSQPVRDKTIQHLKAWMVDSDAV